MHVLTFQLSGDLALWRNPYEPVGSYSALGPAPSNLAGLLGAVMGWAGPRSYAMIEPHSNEAEQVKKTRKKGAIGPVWPVAPDLLAWQKTQDLHLACAWLGGNPRRISWNVNGYKNTDMENLRLQQQVIVRPCYRVAVGLKEETAADELAMHLRSPVFPVYLGESAFRGIITNIARVEDAGVNAAPHGWAYRVEHLGLGELMPFSRHVVASAEPSKRVVTEGFWTYPTPLHAPPVQAEIPWVQAYAEE